MSQTLPSGTAVLGPTPLERLRHAAEHLTEALHAVNLPLLDDPSAVDAMMILEHAGRAVDAARVFSTTDIGRRAGRDPDEGLATKLGCTSSLDLITGITRISRREARRRLKLGAQTADRESLARVLPPFFPAVADGLDSGDLGVDSAEVIVQGLKTVSPGVD
ncbi:MAG: DUF222 domain-containing protein, partial [Cryobacterium sp.]